MKIILPALLFFLPVMFLGAEPAEREIDAYRAAMRALADELNEAARQQAEQEKKALQEQEKAAAAQAEEAKKKEA